MADEQTVRVARANLADWLRKPLALDEWRSDLANGMLQFKERVETKARERGLHVLVASGVEREYCPNEPNGGIVYLCGFFALETPKLRGQQPDHKYMVLTPADYRKAYAGNSILIVGGPVSMYLFHKDIVKEVADCLGEEVKEWGGGHYEGFAIKSNYPKVHGDSHHFGPFQMPEAVAGMLAKLKFHTGQNRDALEQQRMQTEKLLGLTLEEINAEIIRRIEPWLAYIAGESDYVPLKYSRDPPFPDIKLFEWGSYDRYFHIANMNHVLALSAGFKFEGNEITARFTGEVPERTARLIDIVAKSDIDGQTKDGQMIYIAKTIGNLKRLNLLTQFVEEYAREMIPESIKNFYDQQEKNLGRRNIQFNSTDTLAEIAETHIYDSVVDGVRKLIDVERGRRTLTDGEARWYQIFIREAEENRKRD
jgi:hypothetical protein